MMSRMGLHMGSVAAGVCLMLLGASPVLAKRGRHHEQGQKDPGKHVEYLAKKLDLGDTQRAQVEQIINAHHERAKALMGQLETLRKEKHEQIKAVLTPEQAEKLEKLHARKGTRGWFGRKRGHHDGMPGGPGT